MAAAARLSLAKAGAGNLALTATGVWLGASRRANSPCFDMMAGE
jgi:hypothetical protein